MFMLCYIVFIRLTVVLDIFLWLSQLVTGTITLVLLILIYNELQIVSVLIKVIQNTHYKFRHVLKY